MRYVGDSSEGAEVPGQGEHIAPPRVVVEKLAGGEGVDSISGGSREGSGKAGQPVCGDGPDVESGGWRDVRGRKPKFFEGWESIDGKWSWHYARRWN